MAMNKANGSVSVPKEYDAAVITRIIRGMENLLNALAAGSIEANYSALTAAPTTGTYFVGDQIRNSAPAEAGSASSKYVIIGWVCVTSGTPGTWKELRCLTGN